MTPNYFCNYFEKKTGLTPFKQLNNIRVRQASKMLCQTEKSIVEIAEACGYENANYFLSYPETGEGIDYSATNSYYGLESDRYYGLDYYQNSINGEFSSLSQYYLLKLQSADNSLKIYTYGDLNGDNQITSYDALLILQNTTGLYNFDNEIEFFADNDLNSKIESYDALLVLQYITGNIDDLPKFEDE
jgi:AraC-like DNA-binding protein